MLRNTPKCLFVTLLIAGCGSDSSSPNDANVSGTWSYRLDGLADAQYAGSCAIAPTTLTLTQTGDSIHGTVGATYFICTPSGGAPDTINIIGAGMSVRGELIANDLTFLIDGTYWTHIGTISGDDMGGVSSLTAQVGSETYDFGGDWESHR